MGSAAAKVLIDHFGNLKKISEASVEELQQAPNVGATVALSIKNFFDDADNLNLLKIFE